MSDHAESKRCLRCGRELPAWELPDVCVRCFLDAADRERTPSGGSRSPSQRDAKGPRSPEALRGT